MRRNCSSSVISKTMSDIETDIVHPRIAELESRRVIDEYVCRITMILLWAENALHTVGNEKVQLGWR